MANYATLKSAIQQVIAENGTNAITGSILQSTLLSMVNSLGANYHFAGIATPATNPGTPDQNVFYIAAAAGTYANFNSSFVLTGNEVAIFKYNGTWTKDTPGIASKNAVEHADNYIYYSPSPKPSFTTNAAQTSLTISFPAASGGYMMAVNRWNRLIATSRHAFDTAQSYTINRYQVLVWDLTNGEISSVSYNTEINANKILALGFSGGAPVGVFAPWLVSQMMAEKIAYADIVDNLTSTNAGVPLSAKQGALLSQRRTMDIYYSPSEKPTIKPNAAQTSLTITLPAASGGYMMVIGSDNRLIATSRHALDNEQSYTISRYQVLVWNLLTGEITTMSHNNVIDINRVIFLDYSGGAVRGLAAPWYLSTVIDSENSIIPLNKEVETSLFSAVKQRGFYGPYRNMSGILSIIHFSDLHGSVSNLKRILEYKAKYADYITDILHTGDSVVSSFEQANPFADVAGANMVLNVIGNHDVWQQGHTPPYDATAQQAYEKFIGPFVSAWGVVQPADVATTYACYYYKDYTAAKVRMIILDAMHYDSAQEAWFESVLNGAKTAGYSVLAVNHYPPQQGLNEIECGGFNPFGETIDEVANPVSGERLPSSAYNVVDNFIAGGGEFVCWIAGHTHRDFVGIVKEHPSQIHIDVDKGGDYDGYVIENRVTGAKSQDAFNVLVIDTTEKLIKVVRIGCDVDMFQRAKRAFCLNYATRERIYNF